MRFAHERRNNADNQRQKQPGREQEDAAGQAGRCDALLKQPAGGLDHDQTVGTLHAGAVHLVVENRILVRSQVELRGVLDDPRADVPRELVGQDRVEEVQDANQNRRDARQNEFKPPRATKNSGAALPGAMCTDGYSQ